MSKAQNAGTYYRDRDAVSARLPEVPDGTWDDPAFLVASNSPGIGISTGNEYNPKEQSWDRNDPIPTVVQSGCIIGSPLTPGMGVVCENPGNPLAGGCRVVFLQAQQDVAPGDLLGGVSVFSVYNASARTVKQGEWVWGEAVFDATFAWHFAQEGTLPPQIQFSRASVGSYQTEDGFIRYNAINEPRFGWDSSGAALGWLIEGGYTNDFTASQQFSNPAWVSESATTHLIIDAAAESPSGALDASYFSEPFSGSSRKWFWQDKAYIQGDVITLSAYYKPHPGSNNSWFCLTVSDRSQTDRYAAANVSLQDGGIDVGQSGTDWEVLEARTVPIGNGWTRFYMTAVVGLTAGVVSPGLSLKQQNGFGFYGVWNYAATASRGFYIWGAQTKLGAMTSYMQSTETFTSRAGVGTYTGSDGLLASATIDEERLSYNPGNLTAPPTQVFDKAFTNESVQTELIGQWPRTVDASVSVKSGELDPAGNSNGRFLFSVDGGTGQKYMTNAITGLVIGGTRTVSVWVKPHEGTTRKMCLSIWSTAAAAEWAGVRYDPVTGILTKNQNGNAKVAWYEVHQGTNGWVRVCFMAIVGATSSHSFSIGITEDLTTWGNHAMQQWTGDGSGYYIYGAQFVDGLGLNQILLNGGTPTSTAVDVYATTEGSMEPDLGITSGTDFTDFWNPLEGTIVCRSQRQEATIRAARMVSVSDGGSNIMEIFYNNQVTEQASGNVRIDNVQTAVIATPTSYLTETGHAFAYKLDDFGFSSHGEDAAVDLDSGVPVVDQFWYGRRPGFDSFLDGYLTSITYYNVRQPDATLPRLSGAAAGLFHV